LAQYLERHLARLAGCNTVQHITGGKRCAIDTALCSMHGNDLETQRTEQSCFTRAGRARNQESLAGRDSINKARNNLRGILYRQLIKPRCVVALDAD